MIHFKRNLTEAGRSMVEMMGVLAIMGVLSMIAVSLIRRSLDKAKANEITHDGRVVQAESLARQGEITPGWQSPVYKSATGKTFAMMRDVKDHDYVKVEGVEKDVCKYMLNLQKEGTLIFLTEADFQPFTECQDLETGNNMVFAFDGLEAPAECETTKDCELAHDVGWYCDEAGHCVNCDSDLSDVNVAGDGCECKKSIGAHSCSDDKGHTWCCSADKICGEKVNDCTACGAMQASNEAGDACICDATQAVTCEGEKDGQPYTWCCGSDELGNGQICGEAADECAEAQTICSYTLTQNASSYEADCQYRFTNQEEDTPMADCHYTIVDSVQNAANNIHTITLTADPDHKCKSDKYCYLHYKDGNCGSAASADAGSSASNRDLWGVCLNKNEMNTTCRKNVATIAQLTAVKPCRGDKYCYLYYTNETCGTAAPADLGKNGSEDIYGVCIDKTQVNTQCQITGGEVSLRRNTGCPAGQYCYLNWTEEQVCSSEAGAGYMGVFYGRCIGTKTSSASCPF